MSSSAAADSEGRKLFLGGLPFDVNEDDLRTDMSKFGELEDKDKLLWVAAWARKGWPTVSRSCLCSRYTVFKGAR